MFAKTFLIALLASACLQCQAAPQAPLGSIIDDARDALQKLTDKIEAAISNAIKEAAIILKEFMTFLDEIGQQYKFKVQEEFKKLIEQLNQIKEDAKQRGVDISDCLQGREDALKALPAKYAAAVGQCVGDSAKEAKEVFVNSTQAIKDTVVEIRETGKELDGCGSGLEALACATRVMTRIAAMSGNIPIKIAAETAKVATSLNTLRAQTETCASEQIVKMIDEGQKIIGEIADCANKK